MMIEKTGTTSWDVSIGVGEYNYEVEVVVTAGGIVVHYQLLTWDEIDAAREIACATVAQGGR